MTEQSKLRIDDEPSQYLDAVTFHNGGYCLQNEILVGTGRFRMRRFQAVVVRIEHPQHGAAMIDTGYSPFFFRATSGFPDRIARWLIPVARMPQVSPVQRWSDRGIKIDELTTIFLSHFHADHIGAVTDFPEMRFVYRHQTLATLLEQNPWSRLKNGFARKLLPEDLDRRASKIDEADFLEATYCDFESQTQKLPFPAIDWWGDGSLIMLDMPGHAIGHTGYLLRTKEKSILYVVDACWDVEVLMAEKRLPWVAIKAQYDGETYHRTQTTIRELATRSNWEIVACHCPLTQQRDDHYERKHQGECL